MLNDLSSFTKSSTPLQIASEKNELSTLYKSINFEDFCANNKAIINNSLTADIYAVCNSGQLNSTTCQYIRSTLTEAYYVNRCAVIQMTQLPKGALSFKNYLINTYSSFLQNSSSITLQDVMELNQGFTILGIYEQELMRVWRDLTSTMIS